MEQTDFLLRYFTETMRKEPITEISETFGIDTCLLRMLDNILVKKVQTGDEVTISYIIALYQNGFTLQEIGTLKGISKMGVRYHLKETLSKKEINSLKYRNTTKRKEIKDLIFRVEVALKVTNENYEEIRKMLGYSESYFKLILDNSNRKYRGGKYERQNT